MRVLWVTEDATRPGGVETVLRTLDAGLAARGIESAVYSWAPEPPEVSRRSGTAAWLFAKMSAACSRWCAARATAKALQRHLTADPDLVVLLDTGSLSVARLLVGSPRWGIHVHWTPDLLLRPWRHLAGEGVPRVLVPIVRARMRLAGRTNARLLAAAPFLVSLTASHTRALLSLQPGVHEIRSPIDCQPIVRRTGRAADTITLGYLGRLSWEKGPDVLLDALALVDDSVGPIRTVVAGSGPMADEVRLRAAAMGLGDIEFLGWVATPRRVLDRVDILVLPSRAEAVPLVLVEALAAGCLIVSADAGGGVRDLLDEGRLGTVVPAEDPASLASAIEDAVRDVRARNHPDPQRVAALVASHSPATVIDRWIELLAGPGRAGPARVGPSL